MTAQRQRTGSCERPQARFLASAGIFGLGAVYWFRVRPWMSRWGTAHEELARVMPGDVLIPNPTKVDTHTVTVNTPPEHIWPWLVQMGSGRGGLYSYDWLDRLFGFLDRPSATRILPEFQHLAVGDKIYWGREELTVEVLEPFRALALLDQGHGMQWVWQFGLYPFDDQRTRLVSRGAEWTPDTPRWWLFMRIGELTGFIMTRRFLLGVKQRAETLRASSVPVPREIPFPGATPAAGVGAAG